MVSTKKQGKNNGSVTSTHKVRIVGGMWKRTVLPVSDVDGLRPTPERVRETLFNWLTHLREGQFGQMRALDMFAGTGALGFEAVSRGMVHVTMIEANREVFSRLQQVREKLGASQVTLVLGDAMKTFVRFIQEGQRFDVVFLDPPFRKNLWPLILPQIGRLLARNGLVYIESNEHVTDDKLQELLMHEKDVFRIIREGRAGQVYYHLLEVTALASS